MAAASATIKDDGNVMRLAEEGRPNLRFHPVWLRDNAPDPATRDPGNGQRPITLAGVPTDTRRSDAEAGGDTVTCTFATEDMTVAVDLNWLRANANARPLDTEPGRMPEGTNAWYTG